MTVMTMMTPLGTSADARVDHTLLDKMYQSTFADFLEKDLASASKIKFTRLVEILTHSA